MPRGRKPAEVKIDAPVEDNAPMQMNETPKDVEVTMLLNVQHNGKEYNKGEKYVVTPKVAAHFQSNNFAN